MLNNCRKTGSLYRIIRITVSSILVLALTASLMGAMAAGDLRLLTTRRAVHTVTGQALTAPPLLQLPSQTDSNSTEFQGQPGKQLPQEAPMSSLSRDFSLEGLFDGIENLVLDIILKVIEHRIDSGMAMDPQLLWEFYSRSPSKAFLTDRMADLVGDLLTGERTVTLTLEEVERLITENEALLEEAFGVKFTAIHRTICLKLVERSGALEILNEKGLLGLLKWSAEADTKNGPARLPQLEKTEMQLEQLQKMRNPSVLIALAVTAVVLLVLLGLLNVHRPDVTILGIGLSASVSGLVGTIPLLAGLLQPGLLGGFSQTYLNGILNRPGMLAAVKIILPLNAAVLVLGVIFLLTGAVLMNRRKNIS